MAKSELYIYTHKYLHTHTQIKQTNIKKKNVYKPGKSTWMNLFKYLKVNSEVK